MFRNKSFKTRYSEEYFEVYDHIKNRWFLAVFIICILIPTILLIVFKNMQPFLFGGLLALALYAGVLLFYLIFLRFFISHVRYNAYFKNKRIDKWYKDLVDSSNRMYEILEGTENHLTQHKLRKEAYVFGELLKNLYHFGGKKHFQKLEHTVSMWRTKRTVKETGVGLYFYVKPENGLTQRYELGWETKNGNLGIHRIDLCLE